MTVISPWDSEPHERIRDIKPLDGLDHFPHLDVLQLRKTAISGWSNEDYDHILNACESVHRSKEFMELLREEPFDLVLIDELFNECVLGFVYRLGAPYIMVASESAMSFLTEELTNSSYREEFLRSSASISAYQTRRSVCDLPL